MTGEEPKKRQSLEEMLEQWERKRKDAEEMIGRNATYQELNRAFKRQGKRTAAESLRSTILHW